MTNACRNALDAARARVTDLEREAARLRKRNAELTAMAPEEVLRGEQAAPIAADKPAPSGFARTMVVLAQLCFGIALVAVAGPRIQTVPYAPHPGYAAIFAALGFVCWCCSGFQPLWRSRRQR